jgi:hypothetical protein
MTLHATWIESKLNWIENQIISYWLELKNKIKIQFNSIQFKFNQVKIKCHLISNLIEEKWDANWCRRYWKFAHHYIIYDYDVRKR